MYKDAIIAHEVGVVILHLKVVDLDGCFQNLMLGLFQRDILAVDQYQNVTSTEINRSVPALVCNIEGVCGGGDEFLFIDRQIC